MPKQIILPHMPEDEALAAYLTSIAKHTVTFVVPERGARKDLLELVLKNIEVSYTSASIAAQELAQKLELPKPPNIIECFDISHFSGTNVVGSMVQFANGKPDKSNYRRFKIKTVEGSDDFRSIAEIVRRRYSRLVEERKEMPDLIIIDGGSEQLAFACEELNKLRLSIPIIGLAKKFEEIYLPGEQEPLRFDKKLHMMQLLIAARNEAHRFGLKYHRLLRSKKFTQT